MNISLKNTKRHLYGNSLLTSHGKGVVDRAGGKVKPSVRRKVISKGKDAAIVQDSNSFAAVAKSLCEKTTIIHIDSSEIEKYKEENKFDKAIEVNGIFKMHVVEVNPQMTIEKFAIS